MKIRFHFSHDGGEAERKIGSKQHFSEYFLTQMGIGRNCGKDLGDAVNRPQAPFFTPF